MKPPPDGRSHPEPERPNTPPEATTQAETLQDKELSFHGEPEEVPAGRQEAIMNWDEALAYVEGDRELLGEMATLFLDIGPDLLSAVREAITRHDANSLEKAAHSLKSSVGVFGAHTAQEAALDLEKIGRGGDLARAEEVYRLLDNSIQQLWPALKEMQRKGNVSLEDSGSRR